MAVPKRKTSPSKRGMRRAHDAIGTTAYIEDKDSGELRRPHHIDLKSGMYRGKQILSPKEDWAVAVCDRLSVDGNCRTPRERSRGVFDRAFVLSGFNGRAEWNPFRAAQGWAKRRACAGAGARGRPLFVIRLVSKDPPP